jgi:hypothetical protein
VSLNKTPMEETEEVVVPETTEEETEEVEESIEEVKARLETETAARLKAEEIAENQRKRAEKAEKKGKEPVVAPSASTLSSADLIAVSNAKVHEDDIDKVERYAKSEGLSIKDALQTPELQAMLSVRTEQRHVAEATNIGNVRAGSVQVTDDALLKDASRGILPDSDLEIERLIAAKARENTG